MSKSLILAVEEVKIRDAILLTQSHKTFGMLVKEGVTKMDIFLCKLELSTREKQQCGAVKSAMCTGSVWVIFPGICPHG